MPCIDDGAGSGSSVESGKRPAGPPVSGGVYVISTGESHEDVLKELNAARMAADSAIIACAERLKNVLENGNESACLAEIQSLRDLPNDDRRKRVLQTSVLGSPKAAQYIVTHMSVLAEESEGGPVLCEEGRVDVLCGCAAENLKVVLANLKSGLGVESREGLLKLAGACFEKDHKSTAERIDDFGFKSAELLTLLKVYASQGSLRVAAVLSLIPAFWTKEGGAETVTRVEEADRIELALWFADVDGCLTAQSIKEFDISRPEELEEIYRACKKQAAGRGETVDQYKRLFGIKTSQEGAGT